MLFLPKGQTGEGYEPTKSNSLSDVGEYLVENCSHFSIFRGFEILHI